MTCTLRVLVVDDEPTIIESTGDYLRVRGFEVATARELEEAEALLMVDEFDAVVTDVRLTPGGHEEGLELAAFVAGRSPRTPVIVVTGFASEETERVARERGACLVLQKPVPLSLIEQSLVSITSSCVFNGSQRGVLCEPLRMAAKGAITASIDVVRLAALLSALSPERTDEENTETLEGMLRVIAHLEANSSRQLTTMVGFCLSGSSVLAAIVGATTAQDHAGEAANRLLERVELLKSAR